jgi:hypothetical protein
MDKLELPVIFSKFGMELVSEDPLLWELYRKSNCQNLSDFLNLGATARSRLEHWNQTAEESLSAAVSIYLQTSQRVEKLIEPKSKGDDTDSLPKPSVAPARRASPPAPAEPIEESPLSRSILRICREQGWSARELIVLRGRDLQRPRARKTLAELAETHRTSRDRLIDAENSALEKLRSPVLLERFGELFKDRIRPVWLVMAQGQSTFARSESLKTHENQLSPADLFLIRSLHGSLESWLDTHCSPTAEGWTCPVSLEPPPAPEAPIPDIEEPEQEREEQEEVGAPSDEVQPDNLPVTKGCLARLTSGDVARIRFLLETREALLAEIDEINRSLSAWEHNPLGPAGETVAPAAPAPPRRRMKEEIIAALKAAGPAGVAVLELSQALGIKPASVYTWFYITGAKIPQIQKTGSARYSWIETPADDAPPPEPLSPVGENSVSDLSKTV